MNPNNARVAIGFLAGILAAVFIVYHTMRDSINSRSAPMLRTLVVVGLLLLAVYISGWLP
jgi:hypothetical protein